MNTFLLGLCKSFDFSGRSTRAEYWIFGIWLMVLLVVATLLDAMLGTLNLRLGIGWLSIGVLVLTFVPSLSLSVRRLHDIGQSGWWAGIGLLPGLGMVALALAALFDGQRRTNAYGPDPKQRDGRPGLRSPPAIGTKTARSGAGRTWLVSFVAAGLLFGLLAFAGLRWWHGLATVRAAADAAVTQGEQAGHALVADDCLAQAWQAASATATPTIETNALSAAWLRGCLRTSQGAERLCAEVPAQQDMLASVAWITQSCAAAGANPPGCQTLMHTLASHCDSASSGGKSL